jgi:8-oxo-dGTP pyrophosphatase MutT (NUDIX family)
MNPDEIVDLVDENGLIGMRGIRRGEVRDRKAELISLGLYQPIVIVVVVDERDHVVAQVRGEAKVGDGRGAVDHVCGVISAGESWEQAARREAAEEISVQLKDLVMVDQRVNEYGRHRTLAVARSIGEPRAVDTQEVARVFSASEEELRAMADGDVKFIGGFFSDLKLALNNLQQPR